MSKYIDADLLGSLVDSHGNVHYEHIKSMPSMTLEEIRAEAKKHGYTITKYKLAIPKLKPCTCGHNRRSTWYGKDTVKLVCNKCGRTSSGKNRREAVINWNKEVV